MRLAAFLFAISLSAQVAEKANEHYKTADQRKSVAAGLSNPSRDARQKPRELIAALDIKPGSTVADVGSGTGYMLRFLSQAVGPEGHVISQDIFPDFQNEAKHTAEVGGLGNVAFVLGTETQSKLPEAGVDLILALDVYHHLNYPEKSLMDWKTKLRPGGRLVIVEYHKNEVAMPEKRALQHIRLTEDQAIKEIEASGFKLVSNRDFIQNVQWMGVFQPRP